MKVTASWSEDIWKQFPQQWHDISQHLTHAGSRMIRRGTFRSTDELEKAIYKWLATWNCEPTPFAWKASADVILGKVRRCRELSKTGD